MSYYTGTSTSHDYSGGIVSSIDEEYICCLFYSYTYVEVGTMTGSENMRIMKIKSEDGSITSVKGTYSNG